MSVVAAVVAVGGQKSCINCILFFHVFNNWITLKKEAFAVSWYSFVSRIHTYNSSMIIYRNSRQLYDLVGLLPLALFCRLSMCISSSDDMHVCDEYACAKTMHIHV